MNTVDPNQSTITTTLAGDAVPGAVQDDDSAAARSMDLAHLDPVIRPISRQENLPRAQHILKDLYVNHPPVQRIERQIEHLLRLPRRIRMPGLFLCGDSGMGKTHLLRRIERRHPEQTDRASQRRVRPVLYVQVPADPTVRTLRRSLLDEANIPFMDRPGRPLPESILRRGLAAAGTRLIVLDEIHNIEHVKGERRVLLRDYVRCLSNETQLPICARGNRGVRAGHTRGSTAAEPLPDCASGAVDIGAGPGGLLTRLRARVPVATRFPLMRREIHASAAGGDRRHYRQYRALSPGGSPGGDP